MSLDGGRQAFKDVLKKEKMAYPFRIWLILHPCLIFYIIINTLMAIYANLCLFLLISPPFSFSLLTANIGEQPDQSCEAQQWTGEPNGQADSNLPTGGGMQNVQMCPCVSLSIRIRGEVVLFVDSHEWVRGWGELPDDSLGAAIDSFWGEPVQLNSSVKPLMLIKADAVLASTISAWSFGNDPISKVQLFGSRPINIWQ